MKKTFIFFIMYLWAGSFFAQEGFKRTLFNRENGINLHIDLYEESINVPGMEMFGPMNGYLNGNIYGIWMITSANVQDEKNAVIRLSNDLGSETQEVKLTIKNDSTYVFEQLGNVNIKKVVNKKLVKIPQKIIFSPKKKD